MNIKKFRLKRDGDITTYAIYDILSGELNLEYHTGKIESDGKITLEDCMKLVDDGYWAEVK